MPQGVASGSLASTTPKHPSLQRARVASEDDDEGECFDMRSGNLAGLQPSFNRSLHQACGQGIDTSQNDPNPSTSTNHKRGSRYAPKTRTIMRKTTARKTERRST